MPIRAPFSREALALGASFAALAAPAAAQDQPGTLLPETVVSATREPIAGVRVGSALTVVTRPEIELRQNPFAVEILREVPGVSVGRTGSFGGATEIRLRGAESNHTAVFIDGIKVNDPSLGQTFT